MKSSTILVLLISFLLTRCKSKDSANDFTGTYILQSQGEYAKDYDTLVVSLNQPSANTYIIQNRSGFQKIRNGIVMPKEFKKTSWLATWDDDKKVLAETNLGRQIQFKDDGKSLTMGNSIYKKIN